MRRLRCPECGERYVRTLDRCPSCRAPYHAGPRLPVWWLLLVLLVLVLLYRAADRAGFP